MTSVLNVDTIAAKNGTSPVTLTKQIAIKAYHRFTQHSANTTLDSMNLSSFSDDGTGLSTHNWTNNFSNDDYVMAGSCGSGNVITKYANDTQVATTNVTTSDFHLRVANGSNTTDDDDQSAANWTGDLA